MEGNEGELYVGQAFAPDADWQGGQIIGHRAPKIMLPQDIITKVRQDFPENDATVVLQLLGELQTENPRIFSDRILRCIIFSAQGRFDEFACAVKLARLDWRDVIANAEYDRGRENRLRDFNLSFAQNVA